MPEIKCDYCKNKFLRSRGRINENKLLGHNSYCSKNCLIANRYRRKELICENCGKNFERLLSAISEHNFCSQTCSAIINNQKFPKRGLGFRVCKICIKEFKGKNLYCSRPCFKEARKRHDPQDLINEIKLVNKELGRIPAKREVPQLASQCIYAFGLWNSAIVAAGFQPNRSHDHRMYKRVMTKAKDGHLCDSISEAIVDNWLTNRGIEHKRDFPYPDTQHKADWSLSNKIFIEYFGLAKDSPRYDRDIKIKQDICKKYGIQLIEIYPQDLYPKNKLDLKLELQYL